MATLGDLMAFACSNLQKADMLPDCRQQQASMGGHVDCFSLCIDNPRFGTEGPIFGHPKTSLKPKGG